VRRRHVHLAFAAVSLAFAGLATWEGARLLEAGRVNAAISGARPVDAASDLPQARFMRASALAASGDYEEALGIFRALGREASPPLANDALYNAGNLQLREALKEGPNAAVRALPMIELAKQSYRMVLRRDPEHWDARYNLERALRLAPEIEEPSIPRIRRDAEERVMSTLQSTRGALP